MNPTPEQIAKLPKWAREHLEKLETAAAISAALTWPKEARPKRMNIDEELRANPGKRLVQGWSAHAIVSTFGQPFRVALGCSNGASHSPDNPEKTSSQHCGVFYRTRRDALIECRWSLCEQYARSLANIDKEIEKEAK